MSDKLYELCKKNHGSYIFMQTEAMEEERIRMGWGEVFQNTPYLKNYWEAPEMYQKMIDEADAVIFGGTDEECYIQNRLSKGAPIWRYSERLYKNGRYKFVSPRGLRKKFLDHTRYWKDRVYLLCAGAYVAGDFRLVLSYPGKKYRFGYFPICKKYEWDTLAAGKAFKKLGKVTLFWAARMIDWKHPEVVLELAAKLKKAGYDFKILMACGGEMEVEMHQLAEKLQVDDVVTFLGNQNPDNVRRIMEESDIYLTTSDSGEGWGAVINEAMNSGCAVVANKSMGAAPYLIKHGENGMLYRNGHVDELFFCVKTLIENQEMREKIGKAAYQTISGLWNADVAGERLFDCIQAELNGRSMTEYKEGPMSKEPIIK
jgi:glycosyltransferase involved in cell wall biosynthesis